MTDWPLAAVRFALYGGLGLLFGLPFFTLTTKRGEGLWSLFHLGRVLAILAAISLVLSLLGFAILSAQMSGAPLGQVDPALMRTLLLQTALGWALIVRVAALVLAFGGALLFPPGRTKGWLLTLLSGAALTTLVWSGHGASGENLPGAIHLGGDILHLLAASAWLGALVLLLALVMPRAPATHERLALAHEALANFSVMGSILVAIIVVTGTANGAFIMGLSGLKMMPRSTYGLLLAAKLMLFVGMLMCAACNRFRLTPALHEALVRGALRPGLAALRRSIAFEATLGCAILLLVAWLGMLEPPS